MLSNTITLGRAPPPPAAAAADAAAAAGTGAAAAAEAAAAVGDGGVVSASCSKRDRKCCISLCLNILFSALLLDIPAIKEAWLSLSEKYKSPGYTADKADKAASLATNPEVNNNAASFPCLQTNKQTNKQTNINVLLIISIYKP